MMAEWKTSHKNRHCGYHVDGTPSHWVGTTTQTFLSRKFWGIKTVGLGQELDLKLGPQVESQIKFALLLQKNDPRISDKEKFCGG